ncbi:hypothetical protein KKF84_16920 [Myxococcota bacterium]|nr:hypothetical protein [Myxococcota bacterium]MBU1537009.1 hypothetical protein [Myxococcota bacterium]
MNGFLLAACVIVLSCLPSCVEEEAMVTLAQGTVTDLATSAPLENYEVCVSTREVGSCDYTDDEGHYKIKIYDRFEEVALAEGFEICADPHTGVESTCQTIGASEGNVTVDFEIDTTEPAK